MFTEELKSITLAEAKAEQIRKDAKAEAKAMIDNANYEAQRILADAELKAKDRFESLVKQGTDQAQGKFEKAIHDAMQDGDSLANKARLNQPEAISYIKERMKA